MDFLEIGDAVFIHDPARPFPPHRMGLGQGHLEIRNSLRGIYLGLYAAEMVSKLIEEHDPHPDLFDRLAATLGEIGTARREQVFLAFELDLLRVTGYLPELSACAECGKPVTGRERCYFSAGRGGVVCTACEGTVADRRELDGRLLRLMQGILTLPRLNGSTLRLPHLTRHQTDPINRLIGSHVEQTLGARLHMTHLVT